MTATSGSHRLLAQGDRPLRRTPLLLAHGAWHGAWCWEAFARGLAERGYQVHALDFPGHGEAPRADGSRQPSLREYVSCLAEAVAALPSPPAVIAHSMGGGVLQRYLAVRSLPAAVLLASVPVRGTLAASLRWMRRRPGAVFRHLLLADGWALVATPQQVGEAFLAEDSPVDPASLHARLVPESVRALMPMTVFARLGRGGRRTPMLVAAAERDAIFTVAEQRRTAVRHGADFVVFSGQGHDLMLEPGWPAVVERIDRFLTDGVGLA